MKTRFRLDGSCGTCSGGHLCKACQGDRARDESALSKVLQSVSAGIQQTRIYRVCERCELESDEMQSREEKALAILAANPNAA